MSNPIRKLIQLVLDKNAADKAEKDVKKSLGVIDQGFAKLKKAALSVGAVLAGAFAVQKIVQFGKAAVRAAMEAEVIWNRLGHAVDSTGASFAAVEPEIKALARAMQDVTTVGDEDFAAILTELITTSGDYARSVRNVGVVADLAAAKQMDLRSAAMLVGRAMVGQTATLTRYGIIVEEGADAVEAIRKQFAGFAMNEATTFAGKVKQLTNEWGDFKEALGGVFTTSEGGLSVMQRLIDMVKQMTVWVEENKDTIIRYVDAVMGALQRLATFLGDTIERFDPLAKYTREQRQELATLKNANLLLAKRAEYERDIVALAEEQARLRERAAGAFERERRTSPFGGGGGVGSESGKLAAQADRIEKEIQARQALIFASDDLVDALGRERTALAGGPIPAGEGAGGGAEGPAAPADPEWLTKQRALMELYRQYPAAMDLLARSESDAATQTERLAAAHEALNQQMQVSPANAAKIAKAMDEWAAAAQRVEHQMAVAGEVAQAVGDVMFGVLGSGVGEMAKYKAKQNAIMAAEQLAMGIVASLNPLTAPLAGKHYAAAAKFSAIAAAWGTLAGAAGSFGGRGGGGAGATRDVGGAAAAKSQPPGPEVHIYFDGPGFDAVNPTVQRVIAGASALYAERYGPNATVQTHRRR